MIFFQGYRFQALGGEDEEKRIIKITSLSPITIYRYNINSYI